MITQIESNVVSILESTPMFKNIEHHELQKMLNCLNPRILTYSKSETIVNSQDPFEGIGIVIEGEVLIAKESMAGDRTVMTMLKKGDMFGEMVSFSEKKVWPATVTAQTDCTVIFVSPEKVISMCNKMCDSHRQLIENLLKIMSKKALMLNRKVEYLSIRSLRGKLCAYFLEQHKITNKNIFTLTMNRDELADFFNVARPSVSRELSKMKEEGLIDFHKSSFKILDFEKMKESL
jgi:CRP-like cAMP-binding protein